MQTAIFRISMRIKNMLDAEGADSVNYDIDENKLKVKKKKYKKKIFF